MAAQDSHNYRLLPVDANRGHTVAPDLSAGICASQTTCADEGSVKVPVVEIRRFSGG